MKRKFLVISVLVMVLVLALVLSGCIAQKNPKLLAPKLVYPANGASNVSTNVTLKWSDPNKELHFTSYEVLWGTSKASLSESTGTTATQLKLDLNYSKTYYWQVVGTDKDGKVATSDEWSFTTKALPAPSTPILKITSVSTDSIALQWTKSEYASTITLYSATSTTFSAVKAFPGSLTSYTVTDLEPATLYKFYVVASNTSGKATSTIVSTTTKSVPTPPKPILPSTPVLKITSVSTNTISLEWTESKNASEVDVYSSTSTQFNKLATLPSNATSYTAANLEASTTYKFFVVGINPAGCATSNIVATTTKKTVSPSTVTAFSIYLTDKPAALASVTAVYVNLSDISVHTTLGGSSTWYSMLSTPTTYNLLDLVGTVVSVTTQDLPSSALITQIRLEVASATVMVGTESHTVKIPSGRIYINVASMSVSRAGNLFLDFDLSKSLKKLGNGEYMLSPVVHVISGNERGIVKGKVEMNSQPVVDASVSLSTSATVVAETYTKINGNFTFAAVAIGNYTLTIEASGASTFSTTVTVSKGVNDLGTLELMAPTYPPSKPVVTSIKASGNIVTLSWTDSSTDVSAFKIWRKTDPNQAFVQIASVPSSITTYVDTVELGKKYYYMVSVTNPYGTAWSDSKSVITPPVLTVSPMSTKAGKDQTLSFTVTATSVDGIKEIDGELSTDSSSITTWTGTIKLKSPSTTGLYNATFTAYDNHGNETTVMAKVDANVSLPVISFTSIPATVGVGESFTVSVEATAVGSGNAIKSITIGGSSVAPTFVSSNTYIATATLERNGKGLTTIIATAVDDYGNATMTSENVYVDGTAPKLTMKFIGTGVSAATSTYNFDTNNTTMSATIYTNSVATEISYQFDDSNATLTVHDEYVVNGVSASGAYERGFPYQPLATTVSFPITSYGTETISDMFGNTATYTYTVKIVKDATPPTMSIEMPDIVKGGSTFTATVTVSDVDSGLATDTFVATFNGVPVNSYTYDDTSKTFTLTLDSSTTTGNAMLSAYIEDKAGNATNLSKNIYVDGTPPEITIKISSANAWFTDNASHTWNYTTSGATVYLYYKSLPTFVGTITDNSASSIAATGTYNGGVISTFNGNNTAEVTFSDSLVTGTTNLSLIATDIVENVNEATITFVATQDANVDNVSIQSTPENVDAASPTATLTYNASDSESGIKSAEITVKSTSGDSKSTTLTPGISESVDLMPLINQLSIENKGATDVYVTITATDNVGNSTTTRVATVNVNLTFSITRISTASENGTTVLVVAFNTLASTTSTFTASDISLTYTASGITYYASAVEAMDGTTNMATITLLASGTAAGSPVVPADLLSGDYTVSATNVVSKNNSIVVSNNGTQVTL
jgi:hypothetical protein